MRTDRQDEVDRVSTQVKTPAQGEVDRATRLRLYQLMVELRDFEQRAYELFLENLVRGTSHLALGQEAIAAGHARAVRPRSPARARRVDGGRHGGITRARQRHAPRQGRIDAPDRRHARGDGLLRD